jgi:anthranilate phosphoribosyltransferase
MSVGARLGILGAIIVVAIVGIVIASGGSSTKAPTSANVTIDVKNAKPVGGIKKIKLKLGGTLHLTVHSDTADEVHVHATDQHEDVKKGGTISVTIKPPAAGTSEIELENHNQQLASVTVEP